MQVKRAARKLCGSALCNSTISVSRITVNAKYRLMEKTDFLGCGMVDDCRHSWENVLKNARKKQAAAAARIKAAG